MGKPESAYDKLALEKLYEMSNYCQRVVCRHRFLVNYFGQAFESANCGQCDACLGEYQVLDNALVVAQKILSCVYKVSERFGAYHIAQILHGANTDKVRQMGHERLSTFGLLSEASTGDIMFWIDQLLDQGYLVKNANYSTLSITENGAALLKGKEIPALAKPLRPEKSKGAKKEKTSFSKAAFDNDEDIELFELLRKKRLELANEQSVPAFVIFSDMTLREITREKPRTLRAFANIKGVGEMKVRTYCPDFLTVIQMFLEREK